MRSYDLILTITGGLSAALALGAVTAEVRMRLDAVAVPAAVRVSALVASP